MLLHPELTEKRANARSFTTFFNSISSLDSFEESLPIIQMIGEGSVGGEFATMFTMFINNKLDKLVTPKDVLNNNSWEYIKGQLKSCIGEGNSYRADIASLMTTRIINYAVHYSNNNTVTQPLIDRVTNLITDDIFSNDLKYYIVKGILNGNKQKWSKLMLNPEVIKMTVK